MPSTLKICLGVRMFVVDRGQGLEYPAPENKNKKAKDRMKSLRRWLDEWPEGNRTQNEFVPLWDGCILCSAIGSLAGPSRAERLTLVTWSLPNLKTRTHDTQNTQNRHTRWSSQTERGKQSERKKHAIKMIMMMIPKDMIMLNQNRQRRTVTWTGCNSVLSWLKDAFAWKGLLTRVRWEKPYASRGLRKTKWQNGLTDELSSSQREGWKLCRTRRYCIRERAKEMSTITQHDWRRRQS